MSGSWKDWEGQVVDGQFSLLQHLGGSDHSVVFSTQRGKTTGEKAAIRFVQADPASAEAQLARWKQAAQLSHPNLIKLFESGRCQLAGMDLLYVVMEYAQENLAQFLPQRALSPTETRDMLEPFMETLKHLHGKGFAHGRIKPGNILAIDDQLKLSSDSLARIGESQIIAGKADAYSAPESGTGAVSAAGDVWSLGVTLVEALTQRVPEHKEKEDVQVADSLPQPFLDIARHSLKHDPRNRWTVVEISARLNPPATPPPAPKAPAPAVHELIRGEVFQLPPSISTSTVAAAAAKPAIPSKAAVIDPLSVPLSTVSPLLAGKQHALENQRISGENSPNRTYYILVVLLVALTVGAVLAIPRLRDRVVPPAAPSDPGQSEQPKAQSSAPNDAPPGIAPSQPNVTQKQAAPASDAAAQSSARLAQPSPQTPPQDSPGIAADHTLDKRDVASLVPAPKLPSASAPHSTLAKSSIAAPRFPSGPVSQGEVVSQVLPDISSRARSTIHGTVRVVVKAHVDASGSVIGVEPALSPSRFFGDAAVQAVKRWAFSPAKVADQNVASDWLVRFDFTDADTKVLPSETRP